MFEPCHCILWGDLRKQFRDGFVEGFFGSCLGGQKQCFEFRPSLFDGVQVRRIGRQVEHFRATFLDALLDSVDLVRTQVVHHHHVARTQLRTQAMIQIGEENIAIGGLLDGHRSDHAARAESAQNG